MKQIQLLILAGVKGIAWTLFITLCVVLEYRERVKQLFFVLFLCVLIKFHALDLLFLSLEIFLGATILLVSVVLLIGWCSVMWIELKETMMEAPERLMGLIELYCFFMHRRIHRTMSLKHEHCPFCEGEP